MDELKRALYALVNQAGLSAAEAAKLTLNDLHLAGAEPNVSVVDGQNGRRRTVRLNDWARNAVVTWMLQRPDRPVMLLFPGDHDKGFSPAKVTELLRGYTPPDFPVPGSPSPTGPLPAETVAEEGLPTIRPGVRKAPPPPFRVVRPPMTGPERVSIASRPETVASSRSNTARVRPAPAVSEAGPPPLVSPEAVKSDSRPVPFRTGPVTVPPPQRSPTAATETRRRSFVPLIAGLLALIACGGLVWGIYSTRPEFLAGLIGGADPGDETAVADLASTVTAEQQAASISPVETPTPESTATATSESADIPTPLPAVAETPTPESVETPTAELTATPTAEPTATPTPEPTATPTSAPTNTPPPAPTPTQAAPSGFKYNAPRLISPEQNFHFIRGNTIDLRWESVPGGLAANERYAVRLVYFHATEVTYKGADLRETLWTVPFELYQAADGPEFKYAWYVYVEQVQADGTGVAISPESPARQFIWE